MSLEWSEFIGQEIVLDLASTFVCVGRLIKLERDFALLEEADVHDLRDTTATREQYVLDCRRHGITPNRRFAWVSLKEVVSLSRLADVVID